MHDILILAVFSSQDGLSENILRRCYVDTCSANKINQEAHNVYKTFSTRILSLLPN
jgi:hypothetical protein